MACFAKQDRVFALFYVSLGFVTFPKRAKGGPFSSVLHAASTRVNFSLARPQSGKDGPLSCDFAQSCRSACSRRTPRRSINVCVPLRPSLRVHHEGTRLGASWPDRARGL